GGGGNWSDLGHWASVSGGPANKSQVPQPADNVFFDANSGFTAGNNVVTLNGPQQYCNNMTWSGAANNPKIQGHYENNILNIYGSLELQSYMQYHVGITYFKSNVAGQTIKTNGTSIGAAGYSDYRGNIVLMVQDHGNY